MERREELLPGILDDITLNCIVPKLNWRDSYRLDLVNHRWQQAIRSREFYNARVRAKSTETFAVVRPTEYGTAPGLLSLRDKYFSQLKGPCPGEWFDGSDRKWISLDGKLYGLGGSKSSERNRASRDVYVLDIAGHKQWQRCASMEEGRINFGCAVHKGKIYVFGGVDGTPDFRTSTISGSEVYDPQKNTWTRICPTVHKRKLPTVASLGDKLILFDGINLSEPVGGAHRASDLWEVYDPVTNSWRVVNRNATPGTKFVVQGKLFQMTKRGFSLYDLEKKSSHHLHSLANSVELTAACQVERCGCGLVPVKDEILITAITGIEPMGGPVLLLQSSGFGSKETEIVWTRADEGLPFTDFALLDVLHL